MDLSKCFECESTDGIEYHHIIPRSLGGTKTIPLCFKCHSLVHNKKVRTDSTSALTKAAFAKKRARGEKMGHAVNFTDITRAKGRAAHAANAANNQHTKTARGYATLLRNRGNTLRSIAEKLNLEGFKTARGGQYSAVQVMRLFS